MNYLYYKTLFMMCNILMALVSARCGQPLANRNKPGELQ